MTEHEKLKEICDKIGYGENLKAMGGGYYFSINGNKYNTDFNEFHILKGRKYITQDVREIIFTQEFMDKLTKEHLDRFDFAWNVRDGMEMQKEILHSGLMENLDNLVSYLANLLGIGDDE